MRTIIDTAIPGPQPALTLALLSGTYSAAEDFVREGFPAAVREQGIAAEVVMAEVRAAYFADGSIVRRIREDVVQPAVERGCTRIWLAGISLGGLAALAFAARHEEDLEGIALIAPYPATREVLLELESAGGLDRWKPVIPAEGDLEREAWSWLAGARANRVAVRCYIATDDRFAPGQRRMAQALDAAHVRELPGTHDWEAWRRLWKEFLASSRGVLQ